MCLLFFFICVLSCSTLFCFLFSPCFVSVRCASSFVVLLQSIYYNIFFFLSFEWFFFLSLLGELVKPHQRCIRPKLYACDGIDSSTWLSLFHGRHTFKRTSSLSVCVCVSFADISSFTVFFNSSFVWNRQTNHHHQHLACMHLICMDDVWIFMLYRVLSCGPNANRNVNIC